MLAIRRLYLLVKAKGQGISTPFTLPGRSSRHRIHTADDINPALPIMRNIP